MKKIRINELARELEVKAHLILDALPELGVSEKKTHSSSIDEDVAVKLRQHFGRAPATYEEPEESGGTEQEHGAPEAAAEVAPRPEAPESIPGLPPVTPAPVPAPTPENEPASSAEKNLPEIPLPRLASHPIRPPLAGQLASMPSPPVEPTPVSVTPAPAARPPSPPPAPPAPPVRPIPAHGLPPGTPLPRPTPPPVRPAPQARPGQVISGPRQPLPGTAARPQAPARPAAPARTAPPRTAPPPGPPPAQQPPQGRVLAGQPAARPVVPPRADVLERLRQTQQPRVAPGQPQPRPSAPLRPQTAPIPGQPIYKGPIRPGQPMVSRQGAGRPGAPGVRPGGPRPMHPTARTTRGVEPAVPPPTDQRRPARPPARPARDRSVDREERVLQHPTRRQMPSGPPPISRDIVISEGITVKELSEKLDVKASLVIKKLVERGIFATINQTLDSKLATELSREFGANTKTISFEEEAMREIETAEVEKDLHSRAPVVTIMGHVDHGKTSLLDSIRLAHVAEKEAGGITQHIGAYYVEKNNRRIVFIDTPGHEAFTRMRARGAKVTDIVVLVVAADDGVMPQTLEAIDHARAAKVPIIVAINKIDKADAQPDRVKQQLSDRGLVPEQWGGDTVMVEVSARMKLNLDLLLEMILLVADMLELKANPDRPAMGTVLESKLDRGRGPVATVLVRNGTLHVGDYFICGLVFGKVRAMLDDRGNQIREAGPSMPVEVQGLDSLPDAGDGFQGVTDTAKAKQIVLYREAKAREAALAKSSRLTLEQLHRKMEAGEVKELPIILKADVAGSAEVLADTLQKLSNEKVKIRVLHSGVGAITETDVLLASASNAIIVGFNVRPERNAQALAEQEKVDIRLHTIIYNLTDEMKRAMTGMLEPVFKEVYRGRAEVREVFRVTKVGTVAGCLVQDGQITRDSDIRLLRDNVVIHTGKIGSLRRFKDDVHEVKTGFECGITIDNFNDLKQGDVIEAFVSERVATEVFV